MRIAIAVVGFVLAGALGVQPTTAGLAAAPRTATTTTHPRDDRPPTPRPSHATTYTVLPLGDSLTLGTNSPATGGYRGPLKQLRPGIVWAGTQADGIGAHEGHSGWTIDQLNALIYGPLAGWLSSTRPRFVLLLAGTNDAGKGDSSGQMLADMQALLGNVHRLTAGSLIVVGRPPYVPVNTAAQNAALAAYGDGLAQLGADPAYRPWLAVADLRDMVAPDQPSDGVHPDKAGYGRAAVDWSWFLPGGGGA